MKAKTVFKRILAVILCYLVIPLLASVPGAFLLYTAGVRFLSGTVTVLAAVLLYGLLYLSFRKRGLDFGRLATVNALIVFALVIVYTVLLVIAGGEAEGRLMRNSAYYLVAIPFLPQILRSVFTNGCTEMYLIAVATYLASAAACKVFSKERPDVRRLALPAGIVVLCAALCVGCYLRRPSARYAGHGFDYMHGWSSTDFTDYMVYSEPSKLVSPDRPAPFMIEDPEEMPVLDGAEACYPVYAALAKALYKDIAGIEKDALSDPNESQWDNGKIVTFTNTVNGFARMINRSGPQGDGEVDLLFGARPSKSQLKQAEDAGFSLEITEIGREGFVFFVERDNPVESLTSDQIRAIYHGDITNWKEVGGRNQKIVAFQRPADSGSQTMMEYFMGSVSLKEPMTYETANAMGGVIRRVAEYNGEAGAFGYTFRYFLEGLNQEKNVRMIAVDGVYPTVETIESGAYPLTVPLVVVHDRNTKNPNVKRVIDYLLSEDGQQIIRKTGYGGK
ncbi:MAG: substrate-binding domain-containing protein [Lachnospiraceae bacterium]|nr:substrate-binding domain-containing protein [Lachnospiraceae bacterium]